MIRHASTATLAELHARVMDLDPRARIAWLLPEELFDDEAKRLAHENGYTVGLAGGLQGSVRLEATTKEGRPVRLELIVGLMGLDLESANRAVLEGAIIRLGGEL